MRDDARRWDERYAATSEPRARQPEAIDHRADLVALLPTEGRCVDVASGPGAVTLWLAERGLEVVALDASSVAIGVLHSAARAARLADRIDARVVDLDGGLPVDLHDLDLVVCQRFRDVSLYRPLIDRLRPGGFAVLTVLSAVGTDVPGPFHAPAGELLQAFGSNSRCEIIDEREGDGVAHLVARRT